MLFAHKVTYRMLFAQGSALLTTLGFGVLAAGVYYIVVPLSPIVEKSNGV